MKIISFAWTTPALLAGEKTVTRRDWKRPYADRFWKGDEIAAYDRQPRFRGRHVATIRLTHDPILESTRDAPESDYEAEGFAYLALYGIKVSGTEPKVLWRAWHMKPRDLWVVRFELVSVEPDHADCLSLKPTARDRRRMQRRLL